MSTEKIHYALFNAHPASQPPFTITLGVGSKTLVVNNCEHIPDGVSKIEKQLVDYNLSQDFVLLYPIYIDAMNTDSESTMMNIAWLIKEQADAKGWKFDRIGGLT